MKRFKMALALSTAILTAFSAVVPSAAAINENDIDTFKNNEFSETAEVRELNNDADEEKTASYAEGEAVVILNDGKKAASLSTVANIEETFVINGQSESINAAVISDENLTVTELVNKLSNNPAVKRAMPNYIKHISAITNDTYSDFQWALSNTGQNSGIAGCDTNPEGLWSLCEKSTAECVVAVMDTGIDSTNEDLKDSLWKNTYVGLSGYGGCGYDFTDSGYVGNEPFDDHGHGSHVSGIIAATGDNGRGISGINKRNVKILSAKVADADGNISFSDELEAFNYIIEAKRRGANIKAINCSYCGIGNDEVKETYDEIFNALGELGIVTCVAAGNDSTNIDRMVRDMSTGEYGYVLPAACDSAYCLTVAASDESDKLASFSNYGEQKVDIAAPGTNILSTVSYNVFSPNIYSENVRNELCSSYQNYDNGIYDGEFGYFLPPENFDTNGTAQIVNSGYGGTGKAIKLKAPNASSNYYVFETSFSTENLSSDYYISFEIGDLARSGKVYFVNAPADYLSEITKARDILNFYPWFGYSFKAFPGWMHITSRFDQSLGYDGDYRDTTERKLLIFIDSQYDNFSLKLDEIGISRQGVSENQFGKYDYMDGTSMAAPYVAGAVALLSNAAPSLTAKEITEMIKSESRSSSMLSGYVQNSKVLSLERASQKLGYTPPSDTQPPTSPQTSVGDVNRDGKVDSKDRIMLTRYLAKWKGYESIDLAAADVNNDGKVNAQDRIILARHLAKWADYQKLPKTG